MITTIFELVRDIHKTNALTIFHDDKAQNVTSRETHVLTLFHEDWTNNVTSGCSYKTAPSPGGHVFSPIWTIFELVRDINPTTVLNTAPPPGGHIFQRTRTIF
ncbi:hypothetical protein DPMN_061786 [Dreissena polymorpha]|uniref:Uncharacterized protein n=1 Tax=Dreissena polymorpha TaxID=45954 RepID=A0A9D4C7M7_DREPO|nr:hypothetical protein DPMN_061786 [Dreissena polymorpha]